MRLRARLGADGLALLGALLLASALLAGPRLPDDTGSGLLLLRLALGLGGAVLLLPRIVGFLQQAVRDPQALSRCYGTHPTIVGLTLLVAVGSLMVVLPVLLLLPGARQPSVLGFLLSAVVLNGALVAVVYYVVVRPRIITWRDMGLTPAALATAWRTGLVAAPVLFLLAVAVELLLRGLGVQQTQLASLDWLRSVPLWQYALVVLCAAVVAPVAEEIYFRGYVFRAYLAQKGPLQAYLFSSLLFAVAHLNLPALVPIFCVGLFLAYLYHRTGSVLPGMIAHGFNNLVAFTALYLAL